MFVLKLKWEQKTRLWQDFDDGFLAFWPDLDISDVWFLYTNICSFSSFFFFLVMGILLTLYVQFFIQP